MLSVLDDEGAGLAALLGVGDTPMEGPLEVEPLSESLGILSGLKVIPDCRMSSRRSRISDCWRLRL